jgi:hypothetical protein
VAMEFRPTGEAVAALRKAKNMAWRDAKV